MMPLVVSLRPVLGLGVPTPIGASGEGIFESTGHRLPVAVTLAQSLCPTGLERGTDRLSTPRNYSR